MIAAGQTIGNYRILNKIGTGGMGAVYLAEHPLIGKRVALKVIHRELAGNRDVVSRFFQEARAVNKIGNEHIVEIHDFGVTPEGDHFFIMEYLEGKTLASILSHGPPMEMMRVLHVGAQIANALAAAHAAGIIHRDLKPDNIMLMPRMGDQDFVKVLDFGLAKVFSAATAVKTAAGVLLGTPQYMSPEACESKGDVDHRTDIYALGVLLFQMLTGVLPFNGESMGEVLVKQVTALPPAPRALNPSIPPSVEQIVLRCLAKPVDARFATMMQLREALLNPEGYLRGSPPIAPARSVQRNDGMGEAKTLIAMTAPQAGPPFPTQGMPAYAPPGGAQQKPRYGAPGPLPLPPPPVSMSGVSSAPTMIGGYSGEVPRRATSGMPALPQPQEPKMNTMRIATPVGYSSRPPRRIWPIVMVLAVVAGLGGGALAVHFSGKPASEDPAGSAGSAGSAPTNAGSAAPANAGSAAPTSGSAAPTNGSAAPTNGSAAPTNAGSAAPTNGSAAPTNAGSAAANGSAAPTNAGSNGSAAPTNAGSNGSAASTNAGSNGSAAPTNAGSATPTNAGSAAPTSGAATGSAAPTNGSAAGSAATNGSAAPKNGAAAGSAVPTNAAAKVRMAHLSIDSAPQGASVTGPAGEALGKTPVEIEWPIGEQAVTFELRLGGYRKKQKQVVINGNTALRVDLERAAAAPAQPKRPAPPTEPPASGSNNGLMRPDD